MNEMRCMMCMLWCCYGFIWLYLWWKKVPRTYVYVFFHGNTWISNDFHHTATYPGDHQAGLKQQRWWMKKGPLPQAMRTTRWGFLLVQPISHFTRVAVNLNGPSKTFLRLVKRQGGSFSNQSNLEKWTPKLIPTRPSTSKRLKKNPNSCWHLVFHSVLGQVAANFGGGRSTLAIWG